jgi:low temperature requirement protein LtrA
MAIAMAAIFVVALTIPEAWQDAPGGLNGPLVLVGGWTQTLLFAAALLVDWVGVYLTSRHGNWRLRSAGHWTERHGELIILALGESVVAIGVGAASQPISAPLLLAAILGVAAAVGLCWLYFDVASLAAERRLLEAVGQARVRLALEAYTYGHFPIVAGIVVAALPAAVVLPPLVGLAGLVLILAALIVVETTRYAQIRRNLRGASSPASS